MLSSIFDIEFNPNKHLVHWDRITTLARGGDTLPVTLELDICSICNHRCEWCVDPPAAHSNQVMPVAIAVRILQEAKELGVKGIVFKGGGESTLHPGFAQILQNAGAMDFDIGLVTHGGKLTRSRLVKALVHNCAYIRISIDGPTPEARKEIHGIDDLNAVVKGISNLLALRGKNRHPIVGATFCLDYARRFLIARCIDLGEELGLDYILIRPPFCEEVGFPAPHTPEQAAILRNDIRQAAANHTGTVAVMAGNWVGDQELAAISSEKRQNELARRDLGVRKLRFNGIEHETGRCLASPLFLVVTAECDVYGCCCLRGIPQFSFGKINYDTGMSLTAVLKSQKRQEILARMRRVECLQYCTHPLAKINALIEYLSLPEQYHSSFI